jgi:putative ABC transport system permease protein
MANEPEELGSVTYIYIFSAVAFLLLLIACINYMNLTTARSARRGKEIGIRKVTGSSRLQLISQFLVESTLTALFALALSLGLIALRCQHSTHCRANPFRLVHYSNREL